MVEAWTSNKRLACTGCNAFSCKHGLVALGILSEFLNLNPCPIQLIYMLLSKDWLMNIRETQLNKYVNITSLRDSCPVNLLSNQIDSKIAA